MKKVCTLLLFSALLANKVQAQYNTMPIPDTVVTSKDGSGNTVYNLDIHEGFTQIMPSGNQTLTHGFNQYSFFGPTLIMHEGTKVQMSVFNETNDPTTVHWHGIHLPAVMDGGPHQIIGTGVTWRPHWTVSDSAATYWYHAHLDFETDQLVTMGQAGLIIVKDKQEASLKLPRTYGVDDIPVIMADRMIDTAGMSKGSASNQLVVSEPTDYELTNGVLNALITLPKQIVRLRLLNASTFNVYNLGLSSNGGVSRTDPLYVIASDGGLLNATVKVDITDTAFIVAPGERYEILVNLGSHAIGDTVRLMAYNSQLSLGMPGAGNPPVTPGGPLVPDTVSLGGHNFEVLTIVVGAPTSKPITSLPITLKTNHFPDPAVATNPQTIRFTYATPLSTPIFRINDSVFNMGINNVTMPLGATSEWTIKDTNFMVPPVPPFFGGVWFSHVFHIHDVQFHVISKTDTNNKPIPIPLYQQGWKDDIMIDFGQNIKVIARFDDFADSKWAYMYHCHMLSHEDQAMMAQFIVVDKTAPIPLNTPGTIAETGVKLYPNPTMQRLHIELEDNTAEIYYVTISDVLGRKKLMVPKPGNNDGLDVSMLIPGDYLVTILDTKGNIGYSKFTKL